MRVNLNVQNENTYNQNFKMRFVEQQSIGKYIDSFHFPDQKNNIRKAVDLIKTYVERNPDYGTLSIATLHPSKANYVKNGTFDEFFTSGRNKFKKTSDKYGRENIYMQLDNSDKIQGFYMNPDENPNNLAKWFIETFNYYKSSITKKF